MTDTKAQLTEIETRFLHIWQKAKGLKAANRNHVKDIRRLFSGVIELQLAEEANETQSNTSDILIRAVKELLPHLPTKKRRQALLNFATQCLPNFGVPDAHAALRTAGCL